MFKSNLKFRFCWNIGLKSNLNVEFDFLWFWAKVPNFHNFDLQRECTEALVVCEEMSRLDSCSPKAAHVDGKSINLSSHQS